MDLIDINWPDSHAVILVAKYDASRRRLAHQMARAVTQSWSGSKSSVRVDQIEANKGRIGIDIIRSLYKSTSYRHSGHKLQIVVIHDAQTMTLPAQNAFLKLLEEPPEGVRFILTCEHPQSLITTIRSRCQTVYWRPSSLEAFKQRFNDLTAQEAEKLFYASAGDTLEAERLQTDAGADDNNQPIRNLMSKSLGQAIIDIQSQASDRPTASQTVEKLTKLAHAGLRHAAANERGAWLRRLESALAAQEQISAQVNVKLVMDSLLLEFRA